MALVRVLGYFPSGTMVARQFFEVSQAAYENGALEIWQPYNIIGGIACALWTVAYVQMFRQSKKDQAYGVPLVAVCLNITWELLYSFFAPIPNELWILLDRSWFVMDVFIIYQVFKYGRENQRIPEVKKHFNLVMAVALILSVIGHESFRQSIRDPLGLISAYIINFVMSVLFVFMVLERRDGRGLSWSAAWLKAIGSLGASVQCYYLVPLVNDGLGSQHFLYFLYGGIAFFDSLYIYLLWRARALRR